MKKGNLLGILSLAFLGPLGCEKSALPVAPIPPTSVFTAPSFTTAWSMVKNGSLNTPMGIAVDGNHDVYVTDAGLNAVFKFDSNGTPLTQWGQPGSGDGQFNQPFGIAVNGTGSIYIADWGNHRIEILDSSGNYLSQVFYPVTDVYSFAYPEGVALNAGGDLFVSDVTHLIWRITLSTTYHYGDNGITNNLFNYPVGLTVDDHSNLYVADYQSNKVIKYNYDENTVSAWGQSGTGNGQFIKPADVKMDNDGNVYVADSGNNRVQVFDNNGGYLDSFGNSSSSQQNLNGPFALAIDGTTLYVVDSGNSRVVKYKM